MERTILLTIEYDGTDFFGWQRQPNVPTVQGEVEKALSIICGKPIKINGTSRTDGGVHAFGQRASFSGEFGIPTERIKFAVNNILPGAIRIGAVEEKEAGFHARFNAVGKKYCYKIMNTEEKSPFGRNLYYYVKKPLNLDLMRLAAAEIVGTHDFKCFEASGGEERETTVRTVHSLTLEKQGEEITLEIVGDGFLYNMVRIITGTLVDVGSGKIPAEEMKKILAGKDRTKAGHTAPPQGLYLQEVYY